MLAPVIWCRCAYDGTSHLHGRWCATTHVGGASNSPLATLAVVARGQHEQHSASDAAQPSSLVLTSDDVYEEETTQDGGASVSASWGGENPFLNDGDVSYVYDAVVEDEADALPVGEVHWYPMSPRFDTWLERRDRRPAWVS